jgi:hypothetical protein
MWMKNMAIADQRWRQAWERRIAARNKRNVKLVRMVERLIRHRSWEAYLADRSLKAAGQGHMAASEI